MINYNIEKVLDVNELMKKWMVALLCVFTLFYFQPHILEAKPGSGQGDGGGGGGGVPFELGDSSIKNNETDISLNPEILLTFTNNVVHMSVQESNKTLITLSEQNGESVELEVEMADDQVYPEKKQEVIITPTQSLKNNTAYELVIGEKFQAKNGRTLGEDILIEFTTVDEGEEAVKGEVDQVKENVEETVSTETEKNNNTWLFILIGVLIIGLIFILVRKLTTRE